MCTTLENILSVLVLWLLNISMYHGLLVAHGFGSAGSKSLRAGGRHPSEYKGATLRKHRNTCMYIECSSYT